MSDARTQPRPSGASVIVAITLVVAALALCLFVGWPYAMTRNLHVDEFHDIYGMRLLTTYARPADADPVEIYLVVFGWVIRNATATADMVLTLRGMFFFIFVAALAGVAAAQRGMTALVERLGLLLLFLLFVPAWRHGIEIRHDILLGLGVTFLYAIAETSLSRPLGWKLAGAAGACAALMQLNSHKAVVLAAPALAAIVYLSMRHRALRPRIVLHTCAFVVAGGVAGLALGALIFLRENALHAYVDKLLHFADYASAAKRFSAAPVLWYMLQHGPVQCALSIIGLVHAGLQWRTRGYHSAMIGAFFLVVVVVTLLINPTPFPYNMTWLSIGILISAAHGFRALTSWTARIRVSAMVTGGVVLALAVGTGMHAWQDDTYLHIPAKKQLDVIAAAEALTSATDSVLDASGMVASRPPASKDWILHSLFMPEYKAGRREQFRDIIARDAPPVVIRNYYRWKWLTAADHDAVDAHYVALSPQLWVLGRHSETSAVTFDVIRRGRYLVLATTGHGVRVGGLDHPARTIVTWDVGPQEIVADVGGISITWLGPTLQTSPVVADAAPLFWGVRFK